MLCFQRDVIIIITRTVLLKIEEYPSTDFSCEFPLLTTFPRPNLLYPLSLRPLSNTIDYKTPNIPLQQGQ